MSHLKMLYDILYFYLHFQQKKAYETLKNVDFKSLCNVLDIRQKYAKKIYTNIFLKRFYVIFTHFQDKNS